MNRSKFTYDYDLDRIQNTAFRLGARHSPNSQNVESFAVVLFFDLEDGTRVEVAKIDDTEHDEGGVHLDRYYREAGAEVKNFGIDVEDAWEAEEYMEDNWERFAQTYLQNHGANPHPH